MSFLEKAANVFRATLRMEPSAPQALPPELREKIADAYSKLDGIDDPRRRAESEYQSKLYELREEKRKAAEALMRAYFGDIPERFRGLYNSIPGLFTAKFTLFDRPLRDHLANEQKGLVDPLFRLELIFSPVLANGVVLLNELTVDVHLSTHFLKRIELWPENKPWPGLRELSTISDLNAP